MRNGRTFPYRPCRVTSRSGDGEGQARGVLDAPVKAGRPGCREVRIPHKAETRDEGRRSEGADPMPPRKTAAASAMGARTKTDTGGRVEHTEAIGGTVVKELGIMAPQLREKGCRRVGGGARPPSRGRPQRKGPSDCLPKTQDSAKAQAEV